MNENQPGTDLETALPDLDGILLDAMTGDLELTGAVRRCLPRLQGDVPVNAFNSSI